MSTPIFRDDMKPATVVLPAHNEAETIQCCVKTFMLHPSVFEVLVVSNGSTDETACLASACGARVIELKSSGKGLAISVGVLVQRELEFFGV